MDSNIIQEIKRELSTVVSKSGFFFEKIVTKEFETFPITINSYSKFPVFETFECAFIDGGQASIFVSPSFAIYMFRVCVTTKLYEYICIISLQKNEFRVRYIPHSNEPPLDDFSVLYNDPFLLHARLRIVGVASLARRLSELQFAHKEKLVVIDGSTQVKHELEKKYIHKGIVGLSKTCSYITSSGYSLYSYLLTQEPFDSWIVHGVTKPEMYFVKLHANSNRVCKIDMDQPLSFLSYLKSISNDASFFGYPYPLVKADHLARISGDEQSYFKTRILQQFDELTISQFDNLSSSVDAHDVLDSIKF